MRNFDKTLAMEITVILLKMLALGSIDCLKNETDIMDNFSSSLDLF